MQPDIHPAKTKRHPRRYTRRPKWSFIFFFFRAFRRRSLSPRENTRAFARPAYAFHKVSKILGFPRTSLRSLAQKTLAFWKLSLKAAVLSFPVFLRQASLRAAA